MKVNPKQAVHKLIEKFTAFCKNFGFCFKLTLSANKSNFITLLLFRIFIAVAPLVYLFLERNILNNIYALIGDSASLVWQTLIANFVLYFALMAVLDFLNSFNEKLTTVQLRSLMLYLSVTLLRKTADADISYFDLPDRFDDMTRSRDNSHALYQIVFSTVGTVSNIFFFISTLLVALAINPLIALLCFLVLLPSFLFKKGLEKRYYEFDKTQYRDNRRGMYFYSLLFERGAAKEFRFFSIGRHFLDLYLDIHKRLVNERNRFVRKNNLYNILFRLPDLLLEIGIAIYVVYRILTHALTLGDFTYITGIFGNVRSSLQMLSNDFSVYAGYNQKIEDFKKYFMMAESEIANGALRTENIGDIEFEHVSFHYPSCEQMILNDVSFTLKKGEKAALVGLNGAGKTTLIKLLTRFYEPVSGTIRIGGVDIRELDIASYRKRIASVFQDYFIYNFSIRENVALTDFERLSDTDAVQAALAFADFNNETYVREQNVDLSVGKTFDDDGIELSGGQSQKMAIARAIFRDADLVLLDEPTAALDPEAEHRVLECFERLYNHKSLLMVSHRLSNTVLMDRILVMENGRIIENGTHDALIKANGQYARLFHLQSEKYQPA